jgi:hypothetical protein
LWLLVFLFVLQRARTQPVKPCARALVQGLFVGFLMGGGRPPPPGLEQHFEHRDFVR